MIPIAICDDELLHARQTQAAIRRCEAQAVTRCFETPLALLAAVTQQGYAPRAAVLDIRMAGMDGIELAKRLNALVPGCAVIFLTAYLSYAPDVYETRHVYFVLKSELDRRIGSALRAALAETAAPASLQLATALLEAVPDGVFLRCHQSYWANFSHITAMEKDEFVLTGGLRVPISRSYRSAARSAFFANLRGEEG